MIRKKNLVDRINPFDIRKSVFYDAFSDVCHLCTIDASLQFSR